MAIRLVFRACGLLALGLAERGHAQRATSVVSGIVFDSVSRAPLAGAAVQVASRDSAGLLLAATTDSAGRFRITGVPPGRYLMGFYHDALAALGLDVPLRGFELAAGVAVTLDLGIPSGPVVRALRCGGDSAVRGDGMLVGFVRDPQRKDALVGATVTAEWRVIAFDSGRLRTALDRRSATVGTDGTYLLCDLPVDAPLDVRVGWPGRRPIVGEIVVPTTGVQRRDFHLVDSELAGGPATVVGRAEHEGGKRVESGRAAIVALAIDVPVHDGAFVIRGVPLGTWSLEVRAVGVEPRSALVDLVKAGTTTVTVTVTDRARLLEPVQVVGKPSRETEILRDVLARKRFGAGTVFMPGNSWLESAGQIGDVLQAARGFHYQDPDNVVGREATCVSRRIRPDPQGKYFKVYLNGEPFPLGLEMLNRIVPIRDVMAIEAYPDGASAPFLWRLDNPCAVVAVWTKQR